MSANVKVKASYPYCPVEVGERLEKVTDNVFIVCENGGLSSLWNLKVISEMPHLFEITNE